MKARIVAMICLLGLFSLITGCISEMAYMDRVIALGAVGVGYGAIQSQKQGPSGIPAAPGVPPVQPPLPGQDLPWSFPMYTVTSFTGPFVLTQDDGGQERDYTAFYGMLTYEDATNGYETTSGIEYTISYYDSNNRFLFSDSFIYTMGIFNNDTVPFITLYDPANSDIKRAKITDMDRIMRIEGTDDTFKHWFGNFKMFNISRSSTGVSGKLNQYVNIGTVDEEDPDPDKEKEEVVIIAAFYNQFGGLIDIAFDDGGPNHVWEWGIYSLPGTDETATMAEFNVTTSKSFATYSLHIGFHLDRD